MDPLKDVDVKVDDTDHDSTISSPLQQLDSPASSTLLPLDSVAGSPKADSLEYSTEDVISANGIEVSKFQSDDNSINSNDDVKIFQSWNDKGRAQDLFESAGSSLDTSLSSDYRMPSKYTDEFSFTPGRDIKFDRTRADVMTPISPRDAHNYNQLPNPLRMFSPGLSPIHSKSHVRTYDVDVRGSKDTVVIDTYGGSSNDVRSRPLNKGMVSRDGLIIIPISSSADGNAPDTPISNFWRNRFFGGSDTIDGGGSPYRTSFDSINKSTSRHSHSAEVMRMSLLLDDDTVNSSPSSAGESFHTDQRHRDDQQSPLDYARKYKWSNSTSSVDSQGTASLKPLLANDLHGGELREQEASFSTVDTDLHTDQRSLVFPTTATLYRTSGQRINTSTASSVVDDKDRGYSRSMSMGVNRMLYASDDSFITVYSCELQPTKDPLMHPVTQSGASQTKVDSSFNTSGFDELNISKQSMINLIGPYEEVSVANSYSDLNMTKISFLVPIADSTHSNYGDYTLNTDNDDDDHYYSHDVDDSLRSMSFLTTHLPPTRSEGSDRYYMRPHRSDRPPLTGSIAPRPRRNETSVDRHGSYDKGHYFSDSEVSPSKGLFKAPPHRHVADATNHHHHHLGQRTAISRPVRHTSIPPSASAHLTTPSKSTKVDNPPHRFTTPSSSHNNAHESADIPSMQHPTATMESKASLSYSEAPTSLPIGSLFTLLSDNNGRPVFVPILQSPQSNHPSNHPHQPLHTYPTPHTLNDDSMRQTGIASSPPPMRHRMEEEGSNPYANTLFLDRFYYANGDHLYHRTQGAHVAHSGIMNRSSRPTIEEEERHYLARVLEKALHNASSSPSSPPAHRFDDQASSARRDIISSSPHSPSQQGYHIHPPRSKSPYRIGVSMDGRQCLLPSSEYWKDRITHRSMTSVMNSSAFLRMVN